MTEQFSLAEEIQKAMADAMKKRGRANLLIAGRTGVGKSTLVNAVFQGKLATTGQGRPVTQHTREITKSGVPLAIFDTRGLEMADFEATLQELAELVERRGKEADPSEHIHVAWVCIAEDSRRVEDAEVELVSMLEARGVPVIAVVTKARADQGFRATVQELLPLARNVARVRALAEEFDDGHTVAPMGLAELVELTSEVIPEGQRNAFAAAQKADVEQKRRRAHTAVGLAATTAAGIGAVPIPFADALALIPVQVSMLASITAIFGVPLEQGLLATLIAGAATGSGATVAGRAIVGGLLKLIPGAGTVMGGVISAATAAAMTSAFGEAYIATLALLFARREGEPPTPEEITQTFREQLALKQQAGRDEGARLPDA